MKFVMRCGAWVVVAAIVLSACTASPEPSSVPATDAVLDPDADPVAGLSWLRGTVREENDVAVAVDLALVRADGTVAWSTQVPLDPDVPGGLVVAQPRHGLMAFGVRDNGTTVLHSVRGSDGAVTELGRVEDEVVGVAVDPGGAAVFVAVRDNELLRVLRFPVDGGEPDELVQQPDDARLMTTLDRLAVTRSGSHLLLESCFAAGCWWDRIDATTGDVLQLRPPDAGQAVDVTDDVLLATVVSCAAGPCPFVLVDVETGEVRPWDPGVHTARLAVDADGRTVLLHADEGSVPGVVTITDVATGQERVVEAIDRSGRPLGLAREGQDTWVPDGYALLVPPGTNVGEAGGPTLLRISDGTLLHLAEPGES